MNKDLVYLVNIIENDENKFLENYNINEGVIGRTFFKLYKITARILSIPAYIISGIVLTVNPVLGSILLAGVFAANKWISFLDNIVMEQAQKDKNYQRINKEIKNLVEKMDSLSSNVKSDFMKVGRNHGLVYLTFDRYFVYMFDKISPEKNVTLEEAEHRELEIYNENIKKLPEYVQQFYDMQIRINACYKELEPIVKRYEEKK